MDRYFWFKSRITRPSAEHLSFNTLYSHWSIDDWNYEENHFGCNLLNGITLHYCSVGRRIAIYIRYIKLTVSSHKIHFQAMCQKHCGAFVFKPACYEFRSKFSQTWKAFRSNHIEGRLRFSLYLQDILLATGCVRQFFLRSEPIYHAPPWHGRFRAPAPLCWLDTITTLGQSNKIADAK